MDAFFASVEQRDDPSLRGQPVAVGGMHRGVVCAASYEARRFGVRSAIPMTAALKLCPHLKVVPPDFSKYKAASDQVFAIFRSATPLVEGVSLDEAYLDVTDNAWNEPLGVEVAKRLKQSIVAETGLTASAGVAPNKFLAKIASGFRKPDGLTVIAPERVERFLSSLPVDALWGVGPVTAGRLKEAGMTQLVDIRSRTEAELRAVVGSFAPTLLRLSHGEDDRQVEPHRERKSIGSETTFAHDVREAGKVREVLRELVEECCDSLLRHRRFARTVTIKVRYSNFDTITRSLTLDRASQDGARFLETCQELLHKTAVGERPIRLLGVSLSGLVENNEAELVRQLCFPFGA